MSTNTTFCKVSKKQLSFILGVSLPTASKNYQIILDSLQIKNRTFLTQNDLKQYGISE